MEQLQTLRAPTMAQQLPRTEVKPGPASPEVSITNGVQDVDIAKGVATGIALPDARGIETDVARMTKDDFDFERFMHESVSIIMMPANTADDHQFAEVTVNGDYRCLKMGEAYDIPRTHVAVLANAKMMRVEQAKSVAADGSIGYTERGVLRQMYPFSVAHDPSGRRGAEWLMKLLKNAG